MVSVLSLPSDMVRRHAASLHACASDPARPFFPRMMAAGALLRIDAAGALDALFIGYDRMSSDERVRLTAGLTVWLGQSASSATGPAIRNALERVAESDPDEQVRAQARRALEGDDKRE